MRDTPRLFTVLGLAVGAIGIAVMWAAGVHFPVAIPPGIVAVGWAISPTGWGNLTGEAGAAVAAGQAIQLIGVLTALVAGGTATVRRYRRRPAV